MKEKGKNLKGKINEQEIDKRAKKEFRINDNKYRPKSQKQN